MAGADVFYRGRSGYSVDVAALFSLCPGLRDPTHIVERVVDCNFGVLDVKKLFSSDDYSRLGPIFVVLRQPFTIDMQNMTLQQRFSLIVRFGRHCNGEAKRQRHRYGDEIYHCWICCLCQLLSKQPADLYL